MKKLLLLFLLGFGLLTSCNMYQKDSGVPAYVYIEGFELSTNYAEQGTNSSNIRDVWVFVDGNVQGVYPLPCRFPILHEGNITFKLSAGILVNGISATRAVYPFYAQYDTSLSLVRGRTDTIRPRVVYNSQITFGWMEDFESQGFSIRTATVSDTPVSRTTNPSEVFEGVSAMAMRVDQRAPFIRAETNQSFSIPGGGGRAVFLELNYKNNQIFDVGLQFIEADGQFIDQPIYTLAPSNGEWRKQYMNFTPYIQGRTGVRYRVIFEARNALGAGEAGEIFIDNLKLIW
jgi:hypothetical protein